MPLGLTQLAQPILGLEAILVSISQDDLMFDAWSRDGRVLTNEDAAGYLGLFVRTRKEVLDALGFHRGPIRASIETDDRILLFRHIEDEYLLVFIFNANVPFGLARVHADNLQRALTEKLLGKTDVELPSFEGKGATQSTLPPASSTPQTPQRSAPKRPVEHADKAVDQPTLPADAHASVEEEALRIPMPDADEHHADEHDEALLFDPLTPHTTLPASDEDADDNVAFAIGNIDPEHFEADVAPPHSSSVTRPAAQESTATHSPQGASDMSTHEIVIQQTETETQTISTTQRVQTTIQQKIAALDDVTIGRARMTYEGGLPDIHPCDTATERARKTSADPLSRLANEGGRVLAQPVDTPTERYTDVAPNPTARLPHDDHTPPHAPEELGSVSHPPIEPPPTRVQTGVANASTPPLSRWSNEGGAISTQPFDTATERTGQITPNPTARLPHDDHTPPHAPEELGSVSHAPIEPAPTRVQTGVANASTPPLSRWSDEGGAISTQPFDTPTERRSPQPTAQESLAKQLSRLTNEGGAPDPTPVDTATENPRPTVTDPQRQHMTYEGGRSDATPADTATEHSSYNHASAHDIVASVRAAQPETNTRRIESVISYVTEHVPNPNTAHARLAIHARVPLELVRTPHRLSTDQILQLEEAAKIMLGVEKLPL